MVVGGTMRVIRGGSSLPLAPQLRMFWPSGGADAPWCGRSSECLDVRKMGGLPVNINL
jgi:hypothetical protein